jgi:hypothetical protein
MDVKLYGEKELSKKDKETCYQIVKSINEFGVSESQKLELIYLLSLELENREHLQEISDLAKKCKSGVQLRSTLITEV